MLTAIPRPARRDTDLAVIAVHLESDVEICAPQSGWGGVTVDCHEVVIQASANVVHLPIHLLNPPGQMMPLVCRNLRARRAGGNPRFGLRIRDVQ